MRALDERLAVLDNGIQLLDRVRLPRAQDATQGASTCQHCDCDDEEEQKHENGGWRSEKPEGRRNGGRNPYWKNEMYCVLANLPNA